MDVKIIVTIALAILGYLFTYFHRLLFEKREARLRFVEKQINEFYGPLYLMLLSSSTLFISLQNKVGIPVNLDAPQNKNNISEWEIWIRQVFMPLNIKIYNLIIEKAHLLNEKEVPECLKSFMAHTAGYKIIIDKWEKNDFSESFSPFAFPNDIIDYAENSYLKLKKEQLKLMGINDTQSGIGIQ